MSLSATASLTAAGLPGRVAPQWEKASATLPSESSQIKNKQLIFRIDQVGTAAFCALALSSLLYFTPLSFVALPLAIISGTVLTATAVAFIYLKNKVSEPSGVVENLGSADVIVKAEAPKPVQIAHYETIQFEGYDTQRLQTLQTEIDRRGIPLHVCPKRPENVAPPVNVDKARLYLESLTSPYKETFKKVWENNFLYISMDDFDLQLKKCVEEFNGMIKGQSYVVGFASGKSSQWIASLALKDLEYLPDSWMTLGYQSTNPLMYTIHTPKESLTLPDDESKPLVIFDDCGYSGTQLKDTICKIAEGTQTQRTVYVIVPYVSEAARKKITTDYEYSLMKKDQGKVNVVLITSEKRIPWAGDHLSVEEKRLLQDLTSVYVGDQLQSFLCITDWRIPDNFPPGFGRYNMKQVTEGHMDSRAEECYGCSTCRIKKNDYFIAVVDDIPRPYALSSQK